MIQITKNEYDNVVLAIQRAEFDPVFAWLVDQLDMLAEIMPELADMLSLMRMELRM